MLLKEIKSLKTVAGEDRFGNKIAGKDLYDERRVYVINDGADTVDSFMSMEAATRAMKNNPKKFPKGEVHIKTGKEMNKLFHSELAEGDVIKVDFKKKPEYVRVARVQDAGSETLFWNGTNFLATKKNALLMTPSEADKIIDRFKGPAFNLKMVSEEALEVKNAEDLWDEGSASSYTSTAQYLVRPVKGSEPMKYEAFMVIGDKRKPFGTFSAVELKKTLKPIRANQTPDVEGFTTYTDPTEVEAYKYSGEPVRVKLDDDNVVQISKGDYLVRTVKGNSFEYNVEDAGDFESTLRKA